jgi:hypothetical protein
MKVSAKCFGISRVIKESKAFRHVQFGLAVQHGRHSRSHHLGRCLWWRLHGHLTRPVARFGYGRLQWIVSHGCIIVVLSLKGIAERIVEGFQKAALLDGFRRRRSRRCSFQFVRQALHGQRLGHVGKVRRGRVLHNLAECKTAIGIVRVGIMVIDTHHRAHFVQGQVKGLAKLHGRVHFTAFRRQSARSSSRRAVQSLQHNENTQCVRPMRGPLPYAMAQKHIETSPHTLRHNHSGRSFGSYPEL